MPPIPADSTSPETKETSGADGTPVSSEDVSGLKSALDAERKRSREAEKQVAESKKREADYLSQLDQLKAIDPARYEQLEKEAQATEQKRLEENNEWQILKAQKDAAIKKLEEKVQDSDVRYTRYVLAENVRREFIQAGGRIVPDGYESQPIDLIVQSLVPRLKLDTTTSRISILDAAGTVEIGASGEPKTIAEKMVEMRSSASMGIFFEPEAKHSGSGLTPGVGGKPGMRAYTMQQLREGKADVKAISEGRAIISG